MWETKEDNVRFRYKIDTKLVHIDRKRRPDR